jgi:outer membrane receptor protein involved in Fe transport
LLFSGSFEADFTSQSEGGRTVRRTLSSWLVGVVAVLLLAVVGNTAAAQTGKLTGVVTDQATGAPLDGAQIFLQGTGLTTLTSSNGRYFLINVPPGTYSVLARRIGYQSIEKNNVTVQIDVSRDVSFALSAAAATQVDVINVTAEQVPLVQPGTTGSSTNLQADEIMSLPVTNIAGVLALQEGFLEIPQNTDIVSFVSTRQNAQDPVSIRGGRAGETLTLIDGVPINNFVFGGESFNITREAVEQVDAVRGGFEPQYGNALSGIVNIATKEGGSRLAGALNYQTSAVGGALGNTSDELKNDNLLEGFVSGPVPGTNAKLRFMIAGRNSSAADGVFNFDADPSNPSAPRIGAHQPLAQDLFTGWRAFGYNQFRDITGKLTMYIKPELKVSFTAIGYQVERLPFDFAWQLTNFTVLKAPAVTNVEDSLSIGGGSGLSGYSDITQGSIFQKRALYSARWDHTVGRWAYKITLGRFNQSRETCNFYQGICLGKRFADVNFNEQFQAPGVTASMAGTDQFFGGEDLKTNVARFDLQGQATDHHAVQLGAFYQKHDLTYTEFRNVGVNDVAVVPAFYHDTPWDAALYIQDKIEYDFLTVKLGARYDLGQAGGTFFANPRDPTNGTTAREVCNGTFPGVAAFTSGALTGLSACTSSRALLDSATRIAQADDFIASKQRQQFSPRLGVSFPLSERSMVFFNFGRYSQNPLYNNLYQNTGVGTVAGDSAGVCKADAVVPGTTQCYPIIFSDIYTTTFVGNPNLLTEKTTSYEVGYTTEVGPNYALSVAAYSKDQYGLSGTRQAGRDALGNRLFDVGSTYGTSQFGYSVIVNQDFQTVRGFEASLRRRLTNFWGFTVNYTFSQSTTNASAPDQEFQLTAQEGVPVNLAEIPSQLDLTHAFNASFNFRVGRSERPTGIKLLDDAMQNLNASITARAASGLPYTPTVTFAGGNAGSLARNSARAPGTFQMDLQVSKDFQIANVRYGLQLRVANLLDNLNCRQIFPTTGRCDSGAVNQAARQTGNGINDSASSTTFDRPDFYAARRSLNFGARLNF